MIAVLSIGLALLVSAPPPDDPEAAFIEWAQARDIELFRTVCDEDPDLGITCYGLDETRTPTIVEWDDGAFHSVEPAEPGMVSTDGLLTNETPLDCVVALNPPLTVMLDFSIGETATFDEAVDTCLAVEERMAGNPSSDPELLGLVTAVNDELDLIISDVMAGGDPRTHIEDLTTVWQALAEWLT